MKNTQLKNRIFTASLLIPSGILLILYGVWSFFIFLLISGLIMWYEWQNLVAKMTAADTIEEEDAKRWRAMGVFYIMLPLGAALYLSLYVSREFLLMAVMTVMCTDIGAYFVGRRFGGKKLAPSISPNKTQSGALGGLLAALVVGLIFSSQFEANAAFFPLIALVLSAAGQAGDLFESWIKRQAKVKDSGVLLPGHGGVLDRLDGYIFALPLAALIAIAFPSLTTLY